MTHDACLALADDGRSTMAPLMDVNSPEEGRAGRVASSRQPWSNHRRALTASIGQPSAVGNQLYIYISLAFRLYLSILGASPSWSRVDHRVGELVALTLVAWSRPHPTTPATRSAQSGLAWP